MRDAVGQRLPLKSKLLIGAAGMTAAAMSTAAFAADAAPPAADKSPATPAPAPVAAPAATPAQTMTPIDPPKWLPYVDIGGGVGSGFAIGRATAFVPFWQDLDSLMFVRFGAATGQHNNDNNFNLGLGYRTKIDSEVILGAFAGFDSSQTRFDHTFNQFSFGLEAMTADWDIRANAYIAQKKNRAIGNKFELYIKDTTIAILQGQEAALSGFDGEIGYRIFNTESTDVRVFAGAYTFHHADADSGGVGTSFNFPYHDLTGPKLRAEVNIFDLDMLGPQSRLSIEGQISHDNVHHTSEYIGATLRIALGDASGSGAQALDDLDRRMADPVRRNDNVLTQWQFNKPEPVIIYNSAITSKPTNTLYYAEQKSGTGAGTYADQTTIQDAASRGRSGKNAFIVLTDAGGSTINASGTALQSGETLTGAGTFKIRGANSTYPVFSHDFAPGSGPVTLTATSSTNVLSLEGDVNIANLSIAGPFVDAIYGTNAGEVHIANVAIDGGGAGTNGMVFKQTDTSGTSNIVISNSSIAGVTNDGIDLSVSQTTGGTSTTNLTFSDGAITAGNHGLDVTSTASGASNATVYAGIHDSTLTTGGIGAEMSGTTAGTATLAQTLLIDPTTIDSAGDYGIYIHGNITAGTLTQNAVIADVTLTGATHGGLAVLGHAGGGHIYQDIQVSNLSIADADSPVGIVAYGNHGGKVDQTVTIDGLSATHATNDGVLIASFAYSGALVHQTVGINDVDVSDAHDSGIDIKAYVDGGATGIQHVDITDLTANNEGINGVYAYVTAYGATSGAPSVAAQYVSVDHASLNDNGRYGVLANAYADTNAVTRQDITVTNATIDGNEAGIVMNGYAYTGASTQQNIYFAYDTIQHNTFDGVDLHVLADGGNGFAAQYGTIYNVDASDNGDFGFNIGALALASDAEQQFYMVDVTADNEGKSGMQIVAASAGYTAGSYTNYPAHVGQNIYAIYGSFSHNAVTGVSVYNSAAGGAAIDQYIFLYGLDISHNAHNGFYEYSFATGTSTAMPSHLYSTLQILDSVVDHNGEHTGATGIYMISNSVDSTNQRSHTTISGTDVSYNGYDGFGSVALSHGYYSTNLQYVTLTDSTFDHNGGSGAYFKARDIYGPGPYGFAGHIVDISGSDFSHNAFDGLTAKALASGENGRAEQYFTISDSNFSNNGQNGIYDFNYAHDGQLNGALTCYNVQGTTGGCAIVRASMSISDSMIENNGYSGIYIASNAYNFGTIYSQAGHGGAPSLYVAGSTISGNGYAGIALPGSAVKYSALSQTIVIDSTNVTHNGTDGTVFYGGPVYTIPQGGVVVFATAKYQSYNTESVSIQNGSSISDNKGIGVTLAGLSGLNFVQYDGLSILNSTVSGNYTGVVLDSVALASYYVGQKFTSVNSVFKDNIVGSGIFSPKYEGSGVTALMFAKYTQYVEQGISSTGSTFSGNEGVGLGTYFGGVANYQAYQDFSSTHDTFTGNLDGGLAINLNSKYVNLPAPGYNVHQAVYLEGSTFNALSGTNGASISAYSDNATATQLIYVYNDSAGHANSFSGGDVGLAIYGVTADSGTLAATLAVENSIFNANNGGIYFLQKGYDIYSPTAQVGVYGNIFTANSNVGFAAGGYQANQTFAVQGNSFTNPVGSYGISIESHNGSTQIINVHTNTQTGGTPYFFNDPGVSQTITY